LQRVDAQAVPDSANFTIELVGMNFNPFLVACHTLRKTLLASTIRAAAFEGAARFRDRR